MIKGYIIRIKGDTLSERAANRLSDSLPQNVTPFFFDAIVPNQVDRLMKKYKRKWTWPWQGQEFDFKT